MRPEGTRATRTASRDARSLTCAVLGQQNRLRICQQQKAGSELEECAQSSRCIDAARRSSCLLRIQQLQIRRAGLVRDPGDKSGTGRGGWLKAPALHPIGSLHPPCLCLQGRADLASPAPFGQTLSWQRHTRRLPGSTDPLLASRTANRSIQPRLDTIRKGRRWSKDNSAILNGICFSVAEAAPGLQLL